MKKLRKLFAVMAILSTTASPALYSQESCCDKSPAYADSCCASSMTALLPIGALVVAGVLIATTHRHHHNSSYSCSTTHAHCSGSTTSTNCSSSSSSSGSCR